MIIILVIFSFLSLTLTSCGSSSETSSDDPISNAANAFFGDSIQVQQVRDGNIQSCPSATLGEMADAFMSNPSWRDFTSDTGEMVVELKGEISYDGVPAEAVIQFIISNGNFKASYLGIDGADQNLLVLSALFNKMCAAA